MVYGFKRGNTPGFIPLVYMPYTFSKEGKCLHNRFAMLARAQTKLNPRPIEADTHGSAIWFMAEPNRCSIVYPTAAHEGELARERRGFVFERGCVVRRCVAPSSVGCAVHRWSGRFAPNAPLFRPGTAKNAAITPPCVAGSIYMRIEAVSVVLTASIRLCG